MSARDNVWDRRIANLVVQGERLVDKTATAIRGGPTPPGTVKLSQAEQLDQYRQHVQSNPEAVAQLVGTHGAEEAWRYLRRMENLDQRDRLGFGDVTEDEMGPRLRAMMAQQQAGLPPEQGY